MTRWNLTIPEKTDRAVRTFLARSDGKKGDLSRFVDEAVRRRMLDLTVLGIKCGLQGSCLRNEASAREGLRQYRKAPPARARKIAIRTLRPARKVFMISPV